MLGRFGIDCLSILGLDTLSMWLCVGSCGGEICVGRYFCLLDLTLARQKPASVK